MQIRPAGGDDAAAIATLYNAFIRETTVTFETDPIDADEMARRIAEVQGYGLPWLLAEDAAGLLGYAYATRWRARAAYRYAVEASVYLARDAQGAGLGTRLYRQLIEHLRGAELKTVIGGIALPNPASIAMHERLGFRQVACFERVGYKHEQWIDVGYWQLQL